MITPIPRGWRFALNAGEDARLPDFDDSAWRVIDLPHDWQIENNRDPGMEAGGSQGFYPRSGLGWYRYRFTAPETWRSQWAVVRFDGVQRFSTVYLNGVEVGGRPYGYVPFEAPLNGALNYGGENTLVVRVDNTRGGGDRWYSGAGIYRRVDLAVTDRVFIPADGVTIVVDRLDDEAAEIRIGVEIENKNAAPVNVTIRGVVTAPGGAAGVPAITLAAACPANGRAAAETRAAIPRPIRWDVDAPALYGLDLSLDGRDDDAVHTRFGLREARFDGDAGFLLNGKPIKLKGVNLHHDGGALGAAVPVELWRRRFDALKRLGANAIRCSHNPQAAEFYDLADEMGFLVIDEIYDKWTPSGLYYKEFFDDWWEKDLEAMIRRDRNHPSVILWSVGNEIEFQYQDRFYELLDTMAKQTRALDPTRPVSAALIAPVFKGLDDRAPLEKRLDAILRAAAVVDVLMLNYQESYYAALRRAGLRKAIIGSEVFTAFRAKDNQFTDKILRSPWRDVEENDFVAGGFLWAGVDYLGESTGWPCRGWAGSLLDSAGFEKIRSWYVSAQWNGAPPRGAHSGARRPVLKLAVFDEGEPYDMAARYWCFPAMRRHWNYPVPSPMKHVAALTNCDLVRLYQNDQPVREAAPDLSGDCMAHFWLDYQPGTLRAEGFFDGAGAGGGGPVKVIEDTLRSAKRAAVVEIAAPLSAASEKMFFAEIWLKDQYGEPWVLDNPEMEIAVTGGIEIAALDNGDLCSPELYAVTRRTFWNGHVLALLRAGAPGPARITAAVTGMNPVYRDVTIVP